MTKKAHQTTPNQDANQTSKEMGPNPTPAEHGDS
jgi:hypothetical protein